MEEKDKKKPVKKFTVAGFLMTAEAAALLNVNSYTLRKWADEGKIKSYKFAPNDYRLFKKEDIEVFMNEIAIKEQGCN